MSQKYLCPLCSQNSAYVSQYGLADSVICKCQGLNEVGRLIKGQYVPNQLTEKTPTLPTSIIGNNLSDVFVAGEFSFARLKTDEEVARMGAKFQNALQADSQRQMYMSQGQIWVALNQVDDSRSIIMFIRNDSKELENFYLARNARPSEADRNFVVGILRQRKMISN